MYFLIKKYKKLNVRSTLKTKWFNFEKLSGFKPKKLSSSNYKIIWIVRGFWLVLKYVFIVLWSTKMMWAMWLIVSELWEFTVCTLYIVFLFVKTENNNFIKEINCVVCAFIAVENLGKVCENSRADENPWLHLGFSLICSWILGFHQAMKAQKKSFISQLTFNNGCPAIILLLFHFVLQLSMSWCKMFLSLENKPGAKPSSML